MIWKISQAVETAQELLDLSNQDRNKISGLGRAAASTQQVHRLLMENPLSSSAAFPHYSPIFLAEHIAYVIFIRMNWDGENGPQLAVLKPK
jgi:hypothetical protein